jgi:thiol:disulfide interchange protein DsbA
MFAAVVIVLFMLNFDKSKKTLIPVFLALGFLLLFAWFRGVPLPSYAADNLIPFFGKGKIEVRVYTDYFCGPCASIEPKLEPLLVDLLENNSVSIIFVDTPLHRQTKLYVQYFLYILNEEMDFGHAMLARRVLFEAARKNITEKEKLENLLRERNIKFNPFDLTPTFNVLSRYLTEDVITSTPAVVICRDGGKKKFNGTSDILTALEDLKKKLGENPQNPAKK